jgi:hypothetical protein
LLLSCILGRPPSTNGWVKHMLLWHDLLDTVDACHATFLNVYRVPKVLAHIHVLPTHISVVPQMHRMMLRYAHETSGYGLIMWCLWQHCM